MAKQLKYGEEARKALQKGVLLRPLGDVIYFNPPLIIKKEDIMLLH